MKKLTKKQVETIGRLINEIVIQILKIEELDRKIYMKIKEIQLLEHGTGG